MCGNQKVESQQECPLEDWEMSELFKLKNRVILVLYVMSECGSNKSYRIRLDSCSQAP